MWLNFVWFATNPFIHAFIPLHYSFVLLNRSMDFLFFASSRQDFPNAVIFCFCFLNRYPVRFCNRKVRNTVFHSIFLVFDNYLIFALMHVTFASFEPADLYIRQCLSRNPLSTRDSQDEWSWENLSPAPSESMITGNPSQPQPLCGWCFVRILAAFRYCGTTTLRWPEIKVYSKFYVTQKRNIIACDMCRQILFVSCFGSQSHPNILVSHWITIKKKKKKMKIQFIVLLASSFEIIRMTRYSSFLDSVYLHCICGVQFLVPGMSEYLAETEKDKRSRIS